MSFHVGQKIVCVDASLPANPWHRQHPIIKGQVYIVRSLCCGKCGCVDIDGSSRVWESSRFRPITERSTDTGMAILRRILADHKAPARVDAQMNEHDIFDQERA